MKWLPSWLVCGKTPLFIGVAALVFLLVLLCFPKALPYLAATLAVVFAILAVLAFSAFLYIVVRVIAKRQKVNPAALNDNSADDWWDD